MKVALCGDMHWGARNDSQFFLDQFSSFVSKTLIPGCLKHGVTTVIQLGDLMDKRKSVGFMTLKTVKENFFGELTRNGIDVIGLVGNHDIFFKNTVSVNALDLLFDSISNFTAVTEPTVYGSFCLVPWICEENKEQVLRFIDDSKCPYLVGHFEMVGFDMYRGMPCEHGLDPRTFSNFKKVYSGHFHTRSGRDNIEYVGTPYEIIWSDYADEKGFLILDTETGEETWIRNEQKIHMVIRYREEEIKKDFAFGVVKDKYVKVVIESSDNPKKLDAFIKMCYANSPVSLAVVDVRDDSRVDDPDEIVADKDPLTALIDEIQKRHSVEVSSAMVNKSNELYIEAISDKEVIA